MPKEMVAIERLKSCYRWSETGHNSGAHSSEVVFPKRSADLSRTRALKLIRIEQVVTCCETVSSDSTYGRQVPSTAKQHALPHNHDGRFDGARSNHSSNSNCVDCLCRA